MTCWISPQQDLHLSWLNENGMKMRHMIMNDTLEQIKKNKWWQKHSCQDKDLQKLKGFLVQQWQNHGSEKLQKVYTIENLQKSKTRIRAKFGACPSPKILLLQEWSRLIHNALEKKVLELLRCKIQSHLQQKYDLSATKASNLTLRVATLPKDRIRVEEITSCLLGFPWAPYLSFASSGIEEECCIRRRISSTLNYSTLSWEEEYLRLYWKLQEREAENHTFLRVSCFEKQKQIQLQTLCQTAQQVFEERLESLPDWFDKQGVNDSLKCFEHLLQRKSVQALEQQLGNFIYRIRKSCSGMMMPIAPTKTTTTKEDKHFSLDLLQQKAVNEALSQPFCVIAGSAGTGKTRVIQEILEQALGNNENCLVLCQYNKPLANLESIFQVLIKKYNCCVNEQEKEDEKQQVTWSPKKRSLNPWLCKKTICSFLWQYTQQQQKSAAAISSSPPDWNMIILEEAGVTDLQSLVQVLRYISNARFCLVGDPYQLLPIGLGHPFHQITDNLERFPDVMIPLGQIYRQNQESAIMSNIQALLQGERPFQWKQDTTCEWITTSWIKTSQQIQDRFDSAKIQLLLGCHAQFPTTQDLVISQWNMVLAPTNKMVQRLNTILHHAHRGGTDSIPDESHVCNCKCWMKERTRLITTENTEEYIKNTLCLFMGRIPNEPKKVWMKTQDGVLLAIPLSHLQLAYCLTCHRAQGSQFNSVRVFLSAHWQKIDARWLYTSITRARKHLVLVGDACDLQKVVQRGFSWPEYLNQRVVKMVVKRALDGSKFTEAVEF